MNFVKKNLGSLLVCIFELCVGILLFINPVSFAVGIIHAAGIVLLLVGLLSVFRYFRADIGEAVQGQYLSKGILEVMVGIFCIVRAGWFVNTFKILTILYALCILIAGVGKVQWTTDMLRLKKKEWYFSAISAAMSIICAIVILSNPFGSTVVLWQFTAVVLILEAVFDIVVLVRNQE